ncbi:MAG: cytidylate kinase-like family protein [Eubacteriales bacterium]|nr:cytidylate kinase-like family protein [Eubacteriales bacterium]
MNKVITISREFGAGGHSIGKKVAAELGIPFYDKDIVKETAKSSGFAKELIEEEQEERSMKDTILKGISAWSSTYFHDSQDAIHELQTAIIKNLVQQGPCVILGRCADVIMKECNINSLNVFVYADEEIRAKHIGELYGMTDASEIQKLISQKDGSRHNYYKHYTGKVWGDSHNYDMSLNSGMLGFDTCVELIVKAAKATE